MDPELDALLHLYMLNRGVLLTPFHMMALMSPATTEAQVDRHSEAFARGRRRAHRWLSGGRPGRGRCAHRSPMSRLRHSN